jgi:hypothetical protein
MHRKAGILSILKFAFQTMGKLIGLSFFALAVFSCKPALALSFTETDGVLSIFSEGKKLGEFPRVLVSNAAMSSSVVKSSTGKLFIKIVTDVSRYKYKIIVPIIDRNGVPFAGCAYKSAFDSNNGTRWVGVSCSLAPLRQFDPEAIVNEENLLQYRKGLSRVKNVDAKNCSTPQDIKYGNYRITLCVKQAYPDPSRETTIVLDKNRNKIFSVRGYEFIPGGKSDGEFALIGEAEQDIVFYEGNLTRANCRIKLERGNSKIRDW